MAHVRQDGWPLYFDARLNVRAQGVLTLPPAAKAGRRAPVLLIHGRDDTVVTIEHSRRMARALRDANKPVELVELAGEDHWLSSASTRVAMLKQALAFVQEHNPAAQTRPIARGGASADR